jgi:thiazole synthase ThiGH ThiG subunit
MEEIGKEPEAKPEPKGLLALVAKPAEESEDPASMAAEGIMSAVKAGDSAMLADALRTFLEASKSHE